MGVKIVQTEKQIQDAIVETLILRKFMVWRNNSGMNFGSYTNKSGVTNKWAVKMGTPGLPDLFAIKGGTLFGIEVKRPGKHATAIQEERLVELASHGAIPFVVTSSSGMDEVIRDFEKDPNSYLHMDEFMLNGHWYKKDKYGTFRRSDIRRS